MDGTDRPGTALVAGGSGGIGGAVAVVLATAGWDVAVHFLRDADRAAKIVSTVEARGVRALAVRGDLSDPEAVVRVVEQTEQVLGPIAGLVHAAGVGRRAGLEEQSVEDWADTILVNLTSAFLLARAVAPGMRSRGGGAIVNVASIAGITGGIMGPAYAASKGGVIALTRSLARELAPYGIRVNAVAPTLTDTDFLRELGVTEADAASLPLRRFVAPAEVASVVAFLLSPGASYVSGETVKVTGGP